MEFGMRKIKCHVSHSLVVEDAIAEFNERSEEFGITKELDVISISVRDANRPVLIATPGGKTEYSKIIVSIFFWATE